MLSISDYNQRRSLPLAQKVILAQRRIRAWYEAHQGEVYISFSGGKDSTVLLDLVWSLYPEVPAVFADTGLEFPEVRAFVQGFSGVVMLRPRHSFKDIIDRFGYPVVGKEVAQACHDIRYGKSEKLNAHRLTQLGEKWRYLLDAPFPISHKCCYHLKKYPFWRYEKETGRVGYQGTMAGESRLRLFAYLKNGCNAFALNHPRSTPLAVWTDADIWEYLRAHGLPYASVYDQGYTRTGCVFCAFGCYPGGASADKFTTLATTHPSLHRYCMDRLGMGGVLDYVWQGLPA